MPRLVDVANRFRPYVPERSLPRLIDLRTSRALRNPQALARAQTQLATLLQHSSRADEIDQLVPARIRHHIELAETRWHLDLMTRQAIRNPEVLVNRDRTRGYILNFLHHHLYEGLFGSLARQHAVIVDVVANAVLYRPDAQHWMAQQLRVVTFGGCRTTPNDVGFQAIVDIIKPGVVMGLGTDFPGSTRVSMLGRDFMMSSGAARIAQITDSPVVVATVQREGNSTFFELSEPLEPSAYPDPMHLLNAMLAIHEPAILAWPEAVDGPEVLWRLAPDHPKIT